MDTITQIVCGIFITVVGGVILARLTQKPAHASAEDEDQYEDEDEVQPEGDLSPLADAVYQVLRRRVPHLKPFIYYSYLVKKLPPPFNALETNDHQLFDALGEITKACRRRRLPTLSSLVIRRQDDKPGRGYFIEAHPDVCEDQELREEAWENEWRKANSTTYPRVL